MESYKYRKNKTDFTILYGFPLLLYLFEIVHYKKLKRTKALNHEASQVLHNLYSSDPSSPRKPEMTLNQILRSLPLSTCLPLGSNRWKGNLKSADPPLRALVKYGLHVTEESSL